MATCDICKKRRANFPMTVKTAAFVDKDMTLCGVCYKKYIKLKEQYLTKAYKDLVEHTQKVHKDD